MNRDDMLIEADELLSKLESPNLRIFDATILFFREEGELTAYEQHERAHLPGAAFFDHETFSDASSKYMYMALPEAELARQIGRVGIAKDSEVVFYTSGLLACATRAWWLLRYAGHERVRVLNGGLAAWAEAGGELERGARHYQPTTFECKLRPEMFASKEEVLTAMNDAGVCTVNTLSAEAYGDTRIAGSSRLAFDDLMQDMTSFLPDGALAARLEEEAQHERVITYCGGGIAATVNAMAHLIAGNENVSVYDGSMDEWVKEGPPVSKGKIA